MSKVTLSYTIENSAIKYQKYDLNICSLNVTMPEITIPDMETSSFFPVSNSTPVSMNTDNHEQINFKNSEPCSADFMDHNLLVESTSDEESVILEYDKIK